MFWSVFRTTSLHSRPPPPLPPPLRPLMLSLSLSTSPTPSSSLSSSQRLLPPPPLARQDPLLHPLHVVTFSELAAILSLIASFIYLLGFFGIDFLQSFIFRPSNDVVWEDDIGDVVPQQIPKLPPSEPLISSISTEEDEEIVSSVVEGKTPLGLIFIKQNFLFFCSAKQLLKINLKLFPGTKK